MKIKQLKHNVSAKKLTLFATAVFLFGGLLSFGPTGNSYQASVSAACLATAPPTTYGQVTQTVNVTSAGNYRVWARIKAPNTTANSFYFQADGGCAYNMGDAASIPVNTWTWVNYQDGITSSSVSLNFTAGSHTLTYTGKEADVLLDRVMLLSDAACVPTGTGDNCAVNDTTSPSVAIGSPSAGSTVSGAVNVTANAADASGISKVDFIVDGATVSTDTSSAYAYSWNTTAVANGSHTVQAKAYDTSGNTATSTSVSVTVNNIVADTTQPNVSTTAPTNGTTVNVGSVVNIIAAASDNIGIVKVEFIIDGALKNTDTASPYEYAWNTTGIAVGTRNILVKAYDAAGNSRTSAPVGVTIKAIQNGNGDVNKDGRVNALDLSALISHDGQNYATADFNNDGTVGAADMAILLSKWTW